MTFWNLRVNLYSWVWNIVRNETGWQFSMKYYYWPFFSSSFRVHFHLYFRFDVKTHKKNYKVARSVLVDQTVRKFYVNVVYRLGSENVKLPEVNWWAFEILWWEDMYGTDHSVANRNQHLAVKWSNLNGYMLVGLLKCGQWNSPG